MSASDSKQSAYSCIARARVSQSPHKGVRKSFATVCSACHRAPGRVSRKLSQPYRHRDACARCACTCTCVAVFLHRIVDLRIEGVRAPVLCVARAATPRPASVQGRASRSRARVSQRPRRLFWRAVCTRVALLTRRRARACARHRSQPSGWRILLHDSLNSAPPPHRPTSRPPLRRGPSGEARACPVQLSNRRRRPLASTGKQSCRRSQGYGRSRVGGRHGRRRRDLDV